MTQSDFNQSEPKRMIIMGCGALGASVASVLTDKGILLQVLDTSADAFDRLPTGLVEDRRIVPLVGDGTNERDLLKAAIQEASVFMALSGSDTKNALAAQIAKQIFDVPTVICRIDDPSKGDIYADMGIVCVSATTLVEDMVIEAADA
jgi:trk system potassium uptake protein TrkA